jgi:hypothetical protein
MRTPIVAFTVATAIALSGYAFAEPQPLTRGACDAAGMDWNDSANVCGVAVMAADESSSQPLTRADCDAAGMAWNDSANACGVETPSQPLTRADCDAAGMAWNDSANACGVPAAAAAAGAGRAKPGKAMMEPGEKKVVKKVTTRHGTKKTVKRKTAHGTTVKKEKRPILNWLKGSRNKQ